MDSKKIHIDTPKEVNEVKLKELTAMHKEALAVTKNHSVFITNILENQKNMNVEALTIIKDQVKVVEKALENQNATLKILSQSVTMSQHQKNTRQSRRPLFTARNTPLSKRSNWFHPFTKYPHPCHLCQYYGHSFKVCPNIQEAFLGACRQCWSLEHNTKVCKSPKRIPPFKDGYRNPTQLIESLGNFSS